jgi:2',3'-cyclic-nucleotide 2'-phosphodiesterase (5'-nucleotidase family)
MNMFKNLKVIYSTNLKGNLAQAAQLGTLVKEARAEQEPAIVLNGGNTSWGTDDCNYFKGFPMWKALKEMNFDGLTLGLDDFLHSWKNLKVEIPTVQLPVTICNLFSIEKDARITDLPPYIIVEKYAGMKVGILGVIDEKLEFENESTVFLDYADTSLLWATKKLQEQNCNVIIAMAYMNLDRCMEMTQNVAGLDLVICTDYYQDEITELFSFSNCFVSCENTKGGKLAVIELDKS